MLKYFIFLSNMNKYHFLIFLIALLACNNGSNNKNTVQGETTDINVITSKPDTSDLNAILTKLNKEILNSIKEKEYQSVANHIHPTLGVRFSSYATVNVNNDVVVKSAELVKIMKNNAKIFWGSYDGTGDPIDLNAKEYFEEFVYDVDFVNAENVTVNQSSATGNSINNIATVYPECDYVENYFSGFDKKYGGMDWRALRLIFQKEGNRYYLVGIVHDQWTI